MEARTIANIKSKLLFFSSLFGGIPLYIYKQHIKMKWRKSNPHNFTEANTIFPFDKVKVGKYSYGPLNVYQWGLPNECLEIGNYVSIADNVRFILGEII